MLGLLLSRNTCRHSEYLLKIKRPLIHENSTMTKWCFESFDNLSDLFLTKRAEPLSLSNVAENS